MQLVGLLSLFEILSSTSVVHTYKILTTDHGFQRLNSGFTKKVWVKKYDNILTWINGTSFFIFFLTPSSHPKGTLKGLKSHTIAPMLCFTTHCGNASAPLPSSKWKDMFSLLQSAATFSRPEIWNNNCLLSRYCLI